MRPPAIRVRLIAADRDKRVKFIEEFLGEFFDRSRLTYASIGNLEKYDEPLILNYSLRRRTMRSPPET